MTREKRSIYLRAQSAADPDSTGLASTKSGAVVTKTEAQRMADWLKQRGQPNLSAWRRRK